MIYIITYKEEFTESFLSEIDSEAEFAYIVDEPKEKIYQKDVTFKHEEVLSRDDKPIIVVGAEVLKRIFRISGITKLQGSYESLKSKEYGDNVRIGFMLDPKIINIYPERENGIKKSQVSLLQDNKQDAEVEFHYQGHDEVKFSEAAKYLDTYESLVIDLETTSLNPIAGDIIGIVISPNVKESYYFEWSTLDLRALETLIKDKELIGHNMKFDWKYLIEKGLDLHDTKIHCTMILANLSGTETEMGLKPLSMKYTNFGFYDRDLQEEKKKICKVLKIKVGDFNYGMFPADILGSYACYDGVATSALWNLFAEFTEHPMYESLMTATKEIGYMELNGAPIDEKTLDLTIIRYKKEIATVYSKMLKELAKVRDPADFNFNSPKQLGKLFFEDMGLEIIKTTDTGAPSTDVEVLNALVEKGVVMATLLKEYRKLNKFANTYLTNIKASIDNDGRVRTSFNLTGTSSGRLSSGMDKNAGDFAGGKTLNFQNIPSTDKTVKKLFKTFKKDYVILNLDLKNAELWLVGLLAGEPNIMNAFANGEDIHSSAAVNMFKLPCKPSEVKELYPEKRQEAKTVNFAILYMAGPGRIAQELGIDFIDAKRLIDTWFRAYPNVKRWLEHNKQSVENTGVVTTYFKRSRKVENLDSTNKWIREHNIKSAINMLVQSPASDINLIGYCRGIQEIREFGYRFTSFALVHDSIVGEVHKDDLHNVVATFKSAIQNVIKNWVPIGVDVEIGESWGSMKEV